MKHNIKRVVLILMAVMLIFCTACSNATEITKGESVTSAAQVSETKEKNTEETTEKATKKVTEKTTNSAATTASEEKSTKTETTEKKAENESSKTDTAAQEASIQNINENQNQNNDDGYYSGTNEDDSQQQNNNAKESSGSSSSKSTEKATTHTHNYTAKVTKEATCGKNGTIKYTCSCGDSYTETISATGEHNWTGYDVIQEATCCQEEIYRETCSKCGATRDVNSGYYTEHDWEERIDIGVKEVICSWKCNHCGQLFDTTEELLLHQSRDDCHGTYGTYTWSTDPVYYCTVDGETANAMCNTDTAYGTIYVMLDCRYFCKDCGTECFP